MWSYVPTANPISHHAGTVPPRPLAVGDQIQYDSGLVVVVIATTPRLILIAGTNGSKVYRPVFRSGLEGDFSECIYSSGDV